MADLAPTVQFLSQLAGYGDSYVKPGDEVYVVQDDVFYTYRNPGVNPPADGFEIIKATFLPGFWERGSSTDESGLSFNTIAVGVSGSGRLIDIDPTTLNDGISVAWVKSVKDLFRWNATSVATADNITVVNPTLNGVNPGRFFRELTFAPEWMQQRQWVVRPTTGNDENSGADDVTPLASWAELSRRLGATGGARPEWLAGDYHIFSPESAGVVAGPNARPYLSGKRSVTPSGSAFAFNTTIYLHGNTPATPGQGVLFAGPFTISAVTPVSHATNQTLEVASAGIGASWTAAALITLPGTADASAKRCRMVTGANIGGTFWAKEDLGNKLGGNPTAMCDEPSAAQTYTGSFAPNSGTFTPGVGEQFVVETLIQLNSFVLDTDGTISVVTDSLQPGLSESHGATINIMGANWPVLTQQQFSGFLSRAFVAGTRFSGGTSTRNTIIPVFNMDIVNCNFDGFCHVRILAQGNITRGFVHGSSSSLELSSAIHSRTNTSSTRTDGWQINSLGIFNVPNTLGLVIYDSVQFATTCEIWGNGNNFTPILLLANARLYWTSAAVAGGAPPASFFFINVAASNPAGIWIVCDDLTNQNVPAWDIATSAFTAARALTPANLVATVAGGGFNGRFFDPVSGCQMVATQQG